MGVRVSVVGYGSGRWWVCSFWSWLCSVRVGMALVVDVILVDVELVCMDVVMGVVVIMGMVVTVVGDGDCVDVVVMRVGVGVFVIVVGNTRDTCRWWW